MKLTIDFQRMFANVLIGISLFGIGLVLYPVIKDYLVYYLGVESQTETQDIDGFSITIPKIRASSIVYEDVDPWNEYEYQEALQTGVAHAKGTAKPGEDGLVYLFAHSSDVPWRVTRYNTAFYRLFLLDKGDDISLTYEGERYRYRIRESKVVSPEEVTYLTENSSNELILQTCAPIGTDWKRLLVFADPVDD